VSTEIRRHLLDRQTQARRGGCQLELPTGRTSWTAASSGPWSRSGRRRRTSRHRAWARARTAPERCKCVGPLHTRDNRGTWAPRSRARAADGGPLSRSSVGSTRREDEPASLLKTATADGARALPGARDRERCDAHRQPDAAQDPAGM